MSSDQANRGEILVISPHPDDEVIGAGATLLKLRDAGFRIVNLAVGLGGPDQHERRRAELTEACARLGFTLIIPDELPGISRDDDLAKAQTYLTELITKTRRVIKPKLIVSPVIHDMHHGHEVVARAVRDSVVNRGVGARWWMYKIWGHLERPTLYSAFEQDKLDAVTEALEAHQGENDRNDYRKMVAGFAMANPGWGSERIFGLGSSTASEQPYAELLTEVIYRKGSWLEGRHRVLNANHPFASAITNKDLSHWLNSPSPYQT